jgi:hypothetical protein
MVNEIAQLARINEAEVGRLLELPRSTSTRFTRPAVLRPNYRAPDGPESRLLFSLLSNLAMAEHVNPVLLNPDREESGALIAVRDACRELDAEPSIGLLMDRLQGSDWVEVILRAQRYGDEVGFGPEEASNEFVQALANLELARRKRELDELIKTGLATREAKETFQNKNLDYKRLQGALPSA